MNNTYNQNNNQGGTDINNSSNFSMESMLGKSIMRNISIAIVLLVIIYGGYLSLKGSSLGVNKDSSEEINTKAESYTLLSDLVSRLNYKNSNIEKYSFDWKNEKYNGYAISTVSYAGVSESPFNNELKNIGFTEDSNDLAEGHSVGLSVYSKDNVICIIKNEAVNPNSWGTDNPDYSSNQTLACLDKENVDVSK